MSCNQLFNRVPNSGGSSLFETLNSRARSLRVAKGTEVVREGEPTGPVYLVRCGELKVWLWGADGRVVRLGSLAAGEYFGEMGLSAPVRTATVQAVTPVELGVVSRADFELVLAERPDLALEVIRALMTKVQQLCHRLQGMASLSVQERLVHLLHERLVQDHGRSLVSGRPTQQELAEQLGSSRSMVNRVLKGLVAQGYLEIHPHAMYVLRPLPLPDRADLAA